MTDVPKETHGMNWLFVPIFLIAGVLGVIFGGLVIWALGAILSLFLALPFPVIRRLESRGARRRAVLESALIGAAFGLGASMVLIGGGAFLDEKFLSKLINALIKKDVFCYGYLRVLWLPILCGFVVHAVIAVGKEKRFNDIELCGAIYFALSFCAFFLFWPEAAPYFWIAILAAFMCSFIFSLTWSSAALALAPDILRPAPNFKSRSWLEIARTALFMILPPSLFAGSFACLTWILDTQC